MSPIAEKVQTDPEAGKSKPEPPSFRLPAEWEPHAATWIAWPHERDDWPGKFGPIPWTYVEIVRLLSRAEPVHILVQSRRAQRRAADMLDRGSVDLQCVQFHRITTDRCWTRDYGPMFVERESPPPEGKCLVALDWKFNGWSKYANHRHDNRVARDVARVLGMPRLKVEAEVDGKPERIVLEAGAIDANGQGTLLATEECLLSAVQPRNPGLDRASLEQLFARFLGAKHTIWLDRGIAGDDTHGHVDDIARFVDPHTVVTVVEKDEADFNFEPLQENWKRLSAARDQDGNALRVVALPMPAPVLFDGQRLPASYANFYIANGLVLVPTFNDPADREALATLAALLPDRQVVGVYAGDLVWGLGTLHCLTRDQPLGPVVESNDSQGTDSAGR
ncbi:MAG TPA: agmatine deiminase family protein [Isosphaeraceae bacterium]|nr:agmatine deiminase family protein [Isosphaeraceae bacterium]